MNFRKIKEKLTTRNIFLVLFLFISLGYFSISYAQTYVQILLSLAVTGLGVGLIMPNLNTWLLQITPPEIRATATGFLTTSLFAGQFLSPILMDLLPLSNVSSLFGLVSLCIVAGLLPLVWFLFRPAKLA